MSRTYDDYLQDILDAASRAVMFLDGVDFGAFEDNIEKQYAVTRALEIVGEAARNIPTKIQGNYPQLPWKEMIGMRNIVLHEYFGVDNEVIWCTV
jgi:uncharacterized protein with HEPN domain